MLADGVLRGENVQGIFLDGPVTASVSPAGVPGYRTRIDLEGEVTIDAVVDAFNLPYGELLAGQTDWQGTLLLPAAAGAQSLPPKITVASNLAGVALRFPAPFAKSPGEPTNLELNVAFPVGALAIDGYLGATRRFAADFDATPGAAAAVRVSPRGARVRRRAGGVSFGARRESERQLAGASRRRVAAAVALGGERQRPGADWSGVFAGADLNVADSGVRARLGSTRVSARRRTDDWQFELDDAIAGTLSCRPPARRAASRRRHAAAYLNAGDGGAGTMSDLDPRELPGLQLHADEFGIGQRQVGRLDAEILADPLGLRLVSFESATDSFTAQGSGGWFVGDEGDTTRFAVGINSTNVGQMLAQLGFAPFVEAETAEVTASLFRRTAVELMARPYWRRSCARAEEVASSTSSPAAPAARRGSSASARYRAGSRWISATCSTAASYSTRSPRISSWSMATPTPTT